MWGTDKLLHILFIMEFSSIKVTSHLGRYLLRPDLWPAEPIILIGQLIHFGHTLVLKIKYVTISSLMNVSSSNTTLLKD